MNETSKALNRLAPVGGDFDVVDPLFKWVYDFCPRPWLDVGAGDDPMSKYYGFERFDKEEGDATHLSALKANHYGLVWSSHCLEHLDDPLVALPRWWDVVKPGGVLWLLVPDFALYEHGHWPSVMNPDHRWAFSCRGTIRHSKHLILDHLWRSLPGAKLLRLDIQCQNYDISGVMDLVDQTHGVAEASCELVLRKLR